MIHLFSKPKFSNATDEIKYILRTRGKIDQKMCNEKHITTRLGGIIHQLRKQGMDITSEIKQIKTRYGMTTHISIYHLKK